MGRSENGPDDWFGEPDGLRTGPEPGRPDRAFALPGGGLAMLLLLVVGLVWVSGTREDPANKKLATWTIGLLVSQLALGALDVLLRAPNWMQILHLLGADIYWVALVVLAARIAIVPLGCPGGFCKFGFRA